MGQLQSIGYFHDILNARLDGRGPLGVAVSGGGDSVALLYRLAQWNRRPLHVFCVDHGLNPDSARWTQTVADHASAVSARFTTLHWTGPKPATGLSAKARAARHALLADAARSAGVKVLCLAHTSDDVAEVQWMRDSGSNVTAPVEWSPSPAWPQGRGVFLLRPLLHESRADLRDELRGRGIDWIDDPANADGRSLRVRARQATKPAADAKPAPSLDLSGLIDARWAAFGLVGLRIAAFKALAPADARKMLAAAVVCAGGSDKLPRGDSLDAMARTIEEGRVATLCGARIWQADGLIHIVREAGDIGRNHAQPTQLTPGEEVMWDGRYVIRSRQAGTVTATASGRARLSEEDRRALLQLPVELRGILPLFDGNALTLLGQSPCEGIDCVNWVMARFLAACGQVATESAIGTGLAGSFAG